MPIVGKFIADFTAFHDAVQKAEVGLRGMETNANTVGKSLDRMVDQFSGRKIIQEAELMGQTFQLLAEKKIGLTTSELQRMGAVGEAAMAKLKASGEPVPAGIQRIVDEANKVAPAMDAAQKSTRNFGDTLGKAASMFGIAFSVGAITNFVGKVLDTASAIGDLSQQLGISAEAVQRFKYAAELSGSSMDAVATSIQFMNKTLGAEGGGTKKALADVGLNFDEIRKMRPEDAFVAISDALGGMDDKAKQASAGTALLGRGFAELLPAMEDGIKKVGDQTTVMTDQTIADLKRAQDAWQSLWNSVVVSTGNAIGSIKNVVTSIENLQKAMRFGPGGMGFGILSVGEDERIKTVAKEMDQMARKGGAVAESWGKVKGEISGATMSAEDLDVVYKDLDRTYQSTGRTIAANTAAAEKLDDAMVKASKEGGKAFKDFHTGIENVNHQMKMFVSVHLKELGDRGINILKLTTDETVKLGLAWMNMGPYVAGVDKAIMDASATGIHAARNMPPEIKKSTDALGNLSKALSEMASVAGGSFGAIASGFATLVSGANTAKLAIQQIKDSAKATDKFEGILGMTTGILGIVSAAMAGVQAIKGIWNAINQREGRHAVEDFAASFGGFDKLQEKLATLGDEGDRLWRLLTQGTDAGNPAQAARNIAEVEEALAKQADAADKATGATEEQAQATIETASQAAKALDELAPKIKINEDEWKHWGDVVTEQIQRLADAVRALPLPSIPGAAMIGAGAGGGSMAFSNKTTLILDGEVVGETVARQIMQA